MSDREIDKYAATVLRETSNLTPAHQIKAIERALEVARFHNRESGSGRRRVKRMTEERWAEISALIPEVFSSFESECVAEIRAARQHEKELEAQLADSNRLRELAESACIIAERDREQATAVRR